MVTIDPELTYVAAFSDADLVTFARDDEGLWSTWKERTTIAWRNSGNLDRCPTRPTHRGGLRSGHLTGVSGRTRAFAALSPTSGGQAPYDP